MTPIVIMPKFVVGTRVRITEQAKWGDPRPYDKEVGEVTAIISEHCLRIDWPSRKEIYVGITCVEVAR